MYEITQFFWYRIISMCELLLAEFIFAFRLRHRNKFILRSLLGAAACIGLAFAFPIISYDAAYCSLMFFVFFSATAVYIKFCYKEPWANVLFCAIAGYTVQHIAFVTYDLIINATGLSGDELQGIYSNSNEVYEPFQGPVTALIYLFDYIIIYWCAAVFLARRIDKRNGLQLKNKTVLVFVGVVIAVEIILRAVITYYGYEKYDRFYMVLLCVFNDLCCIITLFFQFEVSLRKRLENEVQMLNNMLDKAKEQYAISKENIAGLNMKYHDLKHQIRRIGKESFIEKQALDELENSISVYDSTVKTGNEALDIILTEKSMLCRAKEITLTCAADGSLLDFMNAVDIYSFFGNALDNAIEAVTPLDKEERNIGVNIRKIRSFISISIYNYFSSKLEFEDGLPRTTKGDSINHGYGMKSIRMICEKYKGTMSVETNGRVFNLNVLFALKPEEKQI